MPNGTNEKRAAALAKQLGIRYTAALAMICAQKKEN